MSKTDKTETDETESTSEEVAESPQEGTETPEATETPEEGENGSQEHTEAEEEENPNREAAKYRTKLRDAEDERDTATGERDAARRQLIEFTAAKSLPNPRALWLAGIEPTDLLAEDGTVDPAKVEEAAGQVRKDLGIRSAGQPYSSAVSGINGDPVEAKEDKMTDAFRPPRR